MRQICEDGVIIVAGMGLAFGLAWCWLLLW
jgi:hypothetical protein